MHGVIAIGVSGLVALCLAAIGLYSVVAVAVAQRAREIGVRTALGASEPRIVGLFVRRGLVAATAGLAIGLALSVQGTRLLAAADGRDPPSGLLAVSAMVAVAVLAVALAAAWLPARRAARVDPLRVLRSE
jgi:ABC-type antimicrobial peptide transport system permease subunit